MCVPVYVKFGAPSGPMLTFIGLEVPFERYVALKTYSSALRVNQL